jgi:hypothetical protein
MKIDQCLHGPKGSVLGYKTLSGLGKKQHCCTFCANTGMLRERVGDECKSYLTDKKSYDRMMDQGIKLMQVT